MTLEITIEHRLSASLGEAVMAVVDALRGSARAPETPTDLRLQDNAIEELSDRITSLDGIVGGLVTRLPVLEKRIAAAEMSIAVLVKRLPEMEKAIADLDTGLGHSWAGTDATLSAKIADVDASVARTLATMAARIAALEARPAAAPPDSTRHVPSAGRPAWLTPARAEILDRGWEDGTDVHAIHVAMAALDGPSLPSNQRIALCANYRGLRRPTSFVSDLAKRAAAASLEARGLLPIERAGPPTPRPEPMLEAVPEPPAPADAVQPEQPHAAGPAPQASRPAGKKQASAAPAVHPGQKPQIKATYDQIESWAAVRGVIFTGGNIDEVNARCDRIGHPRFELVDRLHGRRVA